MKRGTVRKSESELVALWVPRGIVRAIDEAVRVEDSDRSKFIRNAIRNRIKQLGFLVAESAKHEEVA